jgi:hypothetical protein
MFHMADLIIPKVTAPVLAIPDRLLPDVDVVVRIGRQGFDIEQGDVVCGIISNVHERVLNALATADSVRIIEAPDGDVPVGFRTATILDGRNSNNVPLER